MTHEIRNQNARSEDAAENTNYSNIDCIPFRTRYSIGHICRGCYSRPRNKRLFHFKTTEQYSASILTDK